MLDHTRLRAVFLGWMMTTTLAGFAGLEWTTRAPLPKAQAGGAAALLEDQLVIAGGTAWENGVKLWLDEVQIYDTRANKWRVGPALPEKLAYGAFAQSAQRLEVFGGTDGATLSRRVWTLDAGARQWKQAGETPTGLVLGRAARIGRKVFLFGGCADVADLTRCSDAVWMREDGGLWREVAKLPHGRVALQASAVHDGQVYLFGGCVMPAPGNLINVAGAWAFDPQTYRWRQLRDLPVPMRGPTAAAGNSGIYLFGGYKATAEEAAGKGPEFGFTAEVWSYDPAANTYQAQTPMPAAMTSAEMFFKDGAFWGAGGEDRMRGRSARTFAARVR